MRRVFLIGLFLLSILLVGVAPFAQANETVIIRPWEDGQVFEVRADQEIIIRNSWADCSPVDVRRFMALTVESLELDGPTVHTVETSHGKYWSKPYSMDPPPDPDCAILWEETMWRSDWLYPLGTLEVGTYDAHFSSILSRRYQLWRTPGSWVLPEDVGLDIDFIIEVVEP
jgi:hypothetical protein